jgi:radical SAM superfamily enzyme YgiQ (UPF0313 family)
LQDFTNAYRNPLDIILFRPPAPNDRDSPLSLGDLRPPLSLGFLEAYLHEMDQRAEIIDLYVQPSPKNSAEYWIQYVKALNPRFIGVYVHSSALSTALEFIETLKRATAIPIVVGGPHFSIFPDSIPEIIDFAICGEGELALHTLLTTPIEGMPRVINGSPLDIDSLPWPSFDYFIKQPYDFAIEMFSMPPIVLPMTTSRGCPFRCRFCSNRKIFKSKARLASAAIIVDEMKRLGKEYGARGIFFREDNFTQSPVRTLEFCSLLRKHDVKMDWACESRIDTLFKRKRLLEEMAACGCKGLYLGVESGSQRVLDLMNKNISIGQIEDVFSRCRKLGIKTYASMVYGYPGETRREREETDEMLERIRPDAVSRAVFIGIPVSDIYEELLESGQYYHIDDAGFLYPNGYRELCAEIYGPSPNRFIP